jgi:hypothetical protein
MCTPRRLPPPRIYGVLKVTLVQVGKQYSHANSVSSPRSTVRRGTVTIFAPHSVMLDEKALALSQSIADEVAAASQCPSSPRLARVCRVRANCHEAHHTN